MRHRSYSEAQLEVSKAGATMLVATTQPPGEFLSYSQTVESDREHRCEHFARLLDKTVFVSASFRKARFYGFGLESGSRRRLGLAI